MDDNIYYIGLDILPVNKNEDVDQKNRSYNWKAIYSILLQTCETIYWYFFTDGCSDLSLLIKSLSGNFNIPVDSYNKKIDHELVTLTAMLNLCQHRKLYFQHPAFKISNLVFYFRSKSEFHPRKLNSSKVSTKPDED